MKNEIKVDINFETRTIKVDGIQLTTDDYNSTKMVFNFDRDEGTKVLEIVNEKMELVYLEEIVNNEVILGGVTENGTPVSIFATPGTYIFEVSLYTEDSKLTSAPGTLDVVKEAILIDNDFVEPYLPALDALFVKIEERNKQIGDINSILEILVTSEEEEVIE